MQQTSSATAFVFLLVYSFEWISPICIVRVYMHVYCLRDIKDYPLNWRKKVYSRGVRGVNSRRNSRHQEINRDQFIRYVRIGSLSQGNISENFSGKFGQ